MVLQFFLLYFRCMVCDPEGFLTCGYHGLCIHFDESRVDPRAAPWFGKDFSAAEGDPQVHQAADGVVFLAVESRSSCVPHDGGKSPTQSSAADIIFQRQWMENPAFPVRFWSVYQFVVRTKQ